MRKRNGMIMIIVSLLTLTIACSQKSEKNKMAQKAEKKIEQPAREKNAILAPDFTLAKLDGEWFKLSDFRGKVVMLNFWGTWCPPCRKEIPDFIKLMEKYNKDGLEIVGVTLTSGSAEKIQKFVDKNKMNYTILSRNSKIWQRHRTTN